MKRSKGRSKRAGAKRAGTRPAERKPARRRAPAGKARRPVAPRATARKAAPRRPAPRKAAAGPLVQQAEGERQLADPVEAAQEDLRALPEKALFDPDVSGRDDDLAELLGEEYVRSVTSGEEQGVELRDEPVPEEEGGPFVESSGQKEFAHDEDVSEREALPTTRARPTRKLR